MLASWPRASRPRSESRGQGRDRGRGQGQCDEAEARHFSGLEAKAEAEYNIPANNACIARTRCVNNVDYIMTRQDHNIFIKLSDWT